MGVAAFAEQSQMVLGNPELVPADIYPSLDPDKKLATTTLLPVVSQAVRFTGPEPTIDEFFHSDPDFMWKNGLLIKLGDPHFWQVQHMIRVGVPIGKSLNKGLTTREHGVVFPATEFDIVARNARDLSHHTVNKTVESQIKEANPDKSVDEIEAPMRSAGHVLIGKMSNQKQLGAKYNSQLHDFGIVWRDIYSPGGGKQWFRNAERRRALVDESAHEAIEVAGTRYDMKLVSVSGLHKALKRTLYNGNYSHTQFAYNWLRLIVVLDKYAKAKKEKLAISFEACQHELKQYQPYLDAKKAREAAELQLQHAA